MTDIKCTVWPRDRLRVIDSPSGLRVSVETECGQSMGIVLGPAEAAQLAKELELWCGTKVTQAEGAEPRLWSCAKCGGLCYRHTPGSHGGSWIPADKIDTRGRSSCKCKD